VTFTGSVETGKNVMKSAANHIASMTLELGRKSPVAILNDADAIAAVDGTIKAVFTNSGQVCSAGSRLIVERDIADEVISSLVQIARDMTFGRGIDDPHLGPLISPEQPSRVACFVDGAKERGLNILCGGQRAIVRGLE
jgi:aldehyde dehydrogenase (NAD+)